MQVSHDRQQQLQIKNLKDSADQKNSLERVNSGQHPLGCKEYKILRRETGCKIGNKQNKKNSTGKVSTARTMSAMDGKHEDLGTRNMDDNIQRDRHRQRGREQKPRKTVGWEGEMFLT